MMPLSVNSSTGTTTNGIHPLAQWLLVPLAALLCLFTIVSNVFVALALISHKRLRKIPATVLVLNLALADLLVGTFVMPMATATLLFADWPGPNSNVCRLWMSIDVICCTASIVTLCAIALDRFLAITIPFQYKFVVTTGRACIVNIVVWLYSIGTLLITLKHDLNQPVDYPNITVTSPKSGASYTPKTPKIECSAGSELEWVRTSTVLSFYIPSAIIGLVYVKVWLLTRALRSAVPYAAPFCPPPPPLPPPPEHNNNKELPDLVSIVLTPPTPKTSRRHQSVQNSNSRNMAKSERLLGPEYCAERRQHEQTLRMHKVDKQGSIVYSLASMFYRKQQTAHANRLAAIILTFYVCWVPFFLCSLMEQTLAQNGYGWILRVCTWLGYANSALNPLVYAVTMKSYRHAFTALICCGTRK